MVFYVFSILEKEYFEKLKIIYNRVIKGKHNDKCPMLLVGNKLDVEKERMVSYNEAKEMADSLGIEYIETSVKTNYNVNEAFEKLAKSIIKSKTLKNKNYNKKCLFI